jgi:protein-L-isoaspartate(D-aspartate) O-methyltransferase
MIQLLGVTPEARVLLVGSNTAYEAALVALLARQVFVIELSDKGAKQTATMLRRVDRSNVSVRRADGLMVWSSEAPFERVLLTSPMAELPPVLVEQLAPGGALVAPVGPPPQEEIAVVIKNRDDTLSWSFEGPAQIGSSTAARSQ